MKQKDIDTLARILVLVGAVNWGLVTWLMCYLEHIPSSSSLSTYL